MGGCAPTCYSSDDNNKGRPRLEVASRLGGSWAPLLAAERKRPFRAKHSAHLPSRQSPECWPQATTPWRRAAAAVPHPAQFIVGGPRARAPLAAHGWLRMRRESSGGGQCTSACPWRGVGVAVTELQRRRGHSASLCSGFHPRSGKGAGRCRFAVSWRRGVWLVGCHPRRCSPQLCGCSVRMMPPHAIRPPPPSSHGRRQPLQTKISKEGLL